MSCEKCPHNECKRLAKGVGKDNAKIVLVTEAPTSFEVDHNGLMLGQLGRTFDTLLRDSGLSRSDCYITPAIMCCPQPYKVPAAKELKCCRDRLIAEIDALKQKKIVVALGASAMKTLSPGMTSIKQSRGMFVHSDELNCALAFTFHPGAIVKDAKLYQDVRADFRRIAKIAFDKDEVKTKANDLQYVVLRTPEEIPDFCNWIEDLPRDELSLDVENKSDGSLLCFAVSWKHNTAVVIAEEAMTEETIKMMSDVFVRKKLIGHYFASDLEKLWKSGFSQEVALGADTMFQSYMINEALYSDENMRGKNGLKYLVRQYLGIADYNSAIKKYYTHLEDCPDIEAVYLYNAYDASYTLILHDMLEEMLDDQARWVLHNVMYPVSTVLYRMSYYGTKVDVEYLNQLNEELTAELTEQLHKMWELAGIEFNPNSPPQMRNLLYKHLDLPVPGKLSADKHHLLIIQDKHPIIPEILSYRKAQKFHSTYVKGLLRDRDANDKIHTTFNVAVTVTGRGSSSAPNLQNQGRGPRARNIFVPEFGYQWFECDESQCELRMLAVVSRDPVMCAIYRNDEDLHMNTAVSIYRCSEADITKDRRVIAKRVNFGIPYGISDIGLCELLFDEGIIISRQEAAEYISNWLKSYKYVNQWINDIKSDVQTTHVVVSPFGRKRHFEYITRENLSEVQRMAINFPIQSGANDVTYMALSRVGPRFDRGEAGDAKLLLTVHDSIDGQAKEPMRAALICKEEMERPVLDGYIPFKADIAIGDKWGNVKEVHVA